MKHAIFAAIALFAVTGTGICSASSAAAAPMIVSPAQQRGDAPAQALPAHAKRIGAVSARFRVKACNASGCGAYVQPPIPVTGYGCP